MQLIQLRLLEFLTLQTSKMINTTSIVKFVLEEEPLSSKDNTHSHTPN